MTATVAGTFSAGANVAGDGDQQSGVLVVGSTLSGNLLISSSGDLDASNRFRVQRSTDNGVTWSNVTNINSVVTNQTLSVSAGQQYRCTTQSLQADKSIGYKLTLEN